MSQKLYFCDLAPTCHQSSVLAKNVEDFIACRVFVSFLPCVIVELPTLHFVAGSDYIIKIKIHSSCEIEDFVETHLSLQAVCDTPIARITGCVSS